LLGLFWFWATELIDNNDEPNGTTVAQQTLTAAPSPTNGSGAGNGPALTEEASGNGTPTEASNGEPKATRTPRDDSEANPTATAKESAGQFEEDDVVVTNADANLRSEPALDDGNILQVLPEGTELTVTGPSVTADDRIWVPVVDNETGDLEGYVAEEVLDAA
jgi:hypothetical protein